MKRNRFRSELRYPRRLLDQPADQPRTYVEGVKVVALVEVHAKQALRHQCVVGDVTVTTVIRAERVCRAPLIIERRDDAFDPAAVALEDLLRGVPLGRSSEGVAARRAHEAPGGAVEQRRGG